MFCRVFTERALNQGRATALVVVYPGTTIAGCVAAERAIGQCRIAIYHIAHSAAVAEHGNGGFR